jgi:hypothetical protein
VKNRGVFPEGSKDGLTPSRKANHARLLRVRCDVLKRYHLNLRSLHSIREIGTVQTMQVKGSPTTIFAGVLRDRDDEFNDSTTGS